MRSIFGFSSSTILPEESVFAPALIFAYSVIGIVSPLYESVKKYFPDFAFLSGTTDYKAPALFLVFIDISIGSSLE